VASQTPPGRSSTRALPVIGEVPQERADAARNREKILLAAQELFAAHGIENVSLDAVAAKAGVGRANVFRRFGDRAGLAQALLSEREGELQEEILRGQPPLGPGAPPTERLLAFVDAQLDLLATHGDLLRVSEGGRSGARYRAGAYSAWHQHVAILLAQARPNLDAEVAAHLLLAPLSADLNRELVRIEGVERQRLRAALRQLVKAWLA
jgi:AcrR family transcriptional regulator